MFRDEIKCIDISPDDLGLSSEDQLRTLHEIMGSNQSVWTSNTEDIEMATFKWTFLMQQQTNGLETARKLSKYFFFIEKRKSQLFYDLSILSYVEIRLAARKYFILEKIRQDN